MRNCGQDVEISLLCKFSAVQRDLRHQEKPLAAQQTQREQFLSRTWDYNPNWRVTPHQNGVARERDPAQLCSALATADAGIPHRVIKSLRRTFVNLQQPLISKQELLCRNSKLKRSDGNPRFRVQSFTRSCLSLFDSTWGKLSWISIT